MRLHFELTEYTPEFEYEAVLFQFIEDGYFDRAFYKNQMPTKYDVSQAANFIYDSVRTSPDIETGYQRVAEMMAENHKPLETWSRLAIDFVTNFICSNNNNNHQQQRKNI